MKVDFLHTLSAAKTYFLNSLHIVGVILLKTDTATKIGDTHVKKKERSDSIFIFTFCVTVLTLFLFFLTHLKFSLLSQNI